MQKLPKHKRIRRRERGQGMTEYVIIVAIIAIATIGVVSLFGNNIRALFGSSANALVGESTNPTELGGTTVGENVVKRDLSNFHERPEP